MLEKLIQLHQANRVVQLSGPNGSGKSTLLEQFHIWLFGQGEKFGPYSQHEAVAENYSSRQLMALVSSDALSFAIGWGITASQLDTPLTQLSSGERTKVLVSMAIGSGGVVVLDEPFSHLDQQSRNHLRKHIENSPQRFVIANHEPGYLDDFPTLILAARS